MRILNLKKSALSGFLIVCVSAAIDAAHKRNRNRPSVFEVLRLRGRW